MSREFEERAPYQRRPEFDAFVQGWGTDCAVDLSARLDLLTEFKTKDGEFTKAELKVIAAMTRRLEAIMPKDLRQ